MSPYIGVGRLHTAGATGVASQNSLGQDDFLGINYMSYNSNWTTYFKVAAEKARNPELYSGTYVGANPSYTYADLNNMFLGVVNGNGEVLAPSFPGLVLSIPPPTPTGKHKAMAMPEAPGPNI
jgi:hypothetical protein